MLFIYFCVFFLDFIIHTHVTSDKLVITIFPSNHMSSILPAYVYTKYSEWLWNQNPRRESQFTWQNMLD